MSQSRPDTERIARALVDYKNLGLKYASTKHKVPSRTLRMWRALYGELPEVEARCAELQTRINEEFLGTAKAARHRLVEIVMEHAEKKDAPFADVVTALRRVNEVVMAHEVLNPSDKSDDDK